MDRCEYVGRKLYGYLDGVLAVRHVILIRAHLLVCRRCRSSLLAERRLLDELYRSDQRRPDEVLRRQVLAALRSAGGESGKDPEAGGVP